LYSSHSSLAPSVTAPSGASALASTHAIAYASDIADTQTELYIPIVKAEKESDGRLRVWGLASDHSKDLDGEVIKASENPDCLGYGFVKFDLNHNSVRGGPVIGDVTQMRILKHADAKKKYPDKKITGDPIEIEGFVYPMGNIPTDDLKMVHHYNEVGAGLGFSIYGARRPGITYERDAEGRNVPVSVPSFISTIAITPQPKNSGSVCYIAKSIHAALQGEFDIETEQTAFDPLEPRMLVFGRDFLAKDLSAQSGSTPLPGATGGEALKVAHTDGPSSSSKSTDVLENPDKSEKWCPHCACGVLVSHRFCPTCGGAVPQGPDTPARLAARRMVKHVKKALDGQMEFERKRHILRDTITSVRHQLKG
jgi:hypothetical protein